MRCLRAIRDPGHRDVKATGASRLPDKPGHQVAADQNSLLLKLQVLCRVFRALRFDPNRISSGRGSRNPGQTSNCKNLCVYSAREPGFELENAPRKGRDGHLKRDAVQGLTRVNLFSLHRGCPAAPSTGGSGLLPSRTTAGWETFRIHMEVETLLFRRQRSVPERKAPRRILAGSLRRGMVVRPEPPRR